MLPKNTSSGVLYSLLDVEIVITKYILSTSIFLSLVKKFSISIIFLSKGVQYIISHFQFHFVHISEKMLKKFEIVKTPYYNISHRHFNFVQNPTK